MSRNEMRAFLLYTFVASIVCWLCACAKPPEETQAVRAEQPINSTPTSSAPAIPIGQPVEANKSAADKKPANFQPPKPSEVKEKVTLVFQKVAAFDGARDPSFVVGDFNGDGSEDLAVAVKPNEGMLIEINSELANWIFEDPQKVAIPGTAPTSRSSANQIPAQAEKGDSLLAIIHGYGQKGWRNPEARQTYLLKNGAGVAMKTRTFETLRNGKEKLPPLRGDAIAQTIGGKSGFIFWTGAKYAWYSPEPK